VYRAGQKFGRTVFMEEEQGTIVVGAQFSYSINIFNEESFTTSSWSSYRDLESSGGKDDNKPGAVYIFTRDPESRTGLGNLLKEPTWPVTEKFKLQPTDAIERMGFGSADGIALNGYRLVVSAPFDIDGGSVHSYDLAFQRVYIPYRQFVVNEGSNEGAPYVEINVFRDRQYLGMPLEIGYGVSDVTAVGVSQDVWERCSLYAIFNRRPQFCGDYLLTSGVLSYGPNDFERKIRIDVANDFCHEEYSEYIKVQLFIPGGPALVGELFNTVVRIDDDDYVNLNNQLNTDYCSKKTGMGGELVVGGEETFQTAHAKPYVVHTTTRL